MAVIPAKAGIHTAEAYDICRCYSTSLARSCSRLRGNDTVADVSAQSHFPTRRTTASNPPLMLIHQVKFVQPPRTLPGGE